MEKKWLFYCFVAFMVIAMTTACYKTKTVYLKDPKGNTVEAKIKFNYFSNKFYSAAVQGEKVTEGDTIQVNEMYPLDLSKSKIIGFGDAPYFQVMTNPGNCIYCAFNGTKWLSWPTGCSPCP